MSATWGRKCHKTYKRWTEDSSGRYERLCGNIGIMMKIYYAHSCKQISSTDLFRFLSVTADQPPQALHDRLNFGIGQQIIRIHSPGLSVFQMKYQHW